MPYRGRLVDTGPADKGFHAMNNDAKNTSHHPWFTYSTVSMILRMGLYFTLGAILADVLAAMCVSFYGF